MSFSVECGSSDSLTAKHSQGDQINYGNFLSALTYDSVRDEWRTNLKESRSATSTMSNLTSATLAKLIAGSETKSVPVKLNYYKKN